MIFYVFDFRHHQDFTSAEPINVRIIFRVAVPAATSLVGYALPFTNKLESVSSGGQRHLDLV